MPEARFTQPGAASGCPTGAVIKTAQLLSPDRFQEKGAVNPCRSLCEIRRFLQAPKRVERRSPQLRSWELKSPNFPKGQIDSGRQHFLADGQAMVPVAIGGEVHHQQTAMIQLQLDWCDSSGGGFAPRSPMAEDEVPAGTEGYRGNGAARKQLPLVVSMLSDVVVAIFIPAEAQGRSWIRLLGNAAGQLETPQAPWVRLMAFPAV